MTTFQTLAFGTAVALLLVAAIFDARSKNGTRQDDALANVFMFLAAIVFAVFGLSVFEII